MSSTLGMTILQKQRVTKLKKEIDELKVERMKFAFELADARDRIAELEDRAERRLTALMEVTEVLECLRRGHGVEVGAMCYPALNNAREAIETAHAECRKDNREL